MCISSALLSLSVQQKWGVLPVMIIVLFQSDKRDKNVTPGKKRRWSSGEVLVAQAAC